MLLVILAVFVLLLTLWDVFITVFSTQGAGPLSYRWGKWIWAGLLHVHRRRPIHRVLSLAGPFVLLSSILLWYCLIGLALLLIFSVQPDSVVHGSSNAPASLETRYYFINTTLSGLGYGDWVPSAFPWTLLATMGTLAGTVVLTVSLSYVLSVVSAAIDRKKLAQSVFGMGASVTQVIDNARLSDLRDSLKNHFLNTAGEIDHQRLKHLAYPILAYFHATSVDFSPARAVLLLADACFVLQVAAPDHRAPVGVLQVANSSIHNFAQLHASGATVEQDPDCPAPLLAAAVKQGAAINSEEFKQALANYLPCRARLLALCRADGWQVG